MWRIDEFHWIGEKSNRKINVSNPSEDELRLIKLFFQNIFGDSKFKINMLTTKFFWLKGVIRNVDGVKCKINDNIKFFVPLENSMQLQSTFIASDDSSNDNSSDNDSSSDETSSHNHSSFDNTFDNDNENDNSSNNDSSNDDSSPSESPQPDCQNDDLSSIVYHEFECDDSFEDQASPDSEEYSDSDYGYGNVTKILDVLAEHEMDFKHHIVLLVSLYKSVHKSKHHSNRYFPKLVQECKPSIQVSFHFFKFYF
jgi:hypothetical protein